MPRISRSRKGEDIYAVEDDAGELHGPFFSRSGAIAWAATLPMLKVHQIKLLHFPELPRGGWDS